MTKDEAARKFVDMLTEQQCRDMLVTALFAICPSVFLEIEKATTPGWVDYLTEDYNALKNAIVKNEQEINKIAKLKDRKDFKKNG